jgi:hypothetical protein
MKNLPPRRSEAAQALALRRSDLSRGLRLFAKEVPRVILKKSHFYLVNL